jgi:hypothetical protein
LRALFDDDGDLDVNRAAALALFLAAAALMTAEPLRARYGTRPAEAVAQMATHLWNTSSTYRRYG